MESQPAKPTQPVSESAPSSPSEQQSSTQTSDPTSLEQQEVQPESGTIAAGDENLIRTRRTADDDRLQAGDPAEA